MHTGVAYDNYDRHVDTETGTDTLHDTVAIIYQDVVDNSGEQPSLEIDIVETEAEEYEEVTESGRQGKRRRRKFDEITPELAPYPKKPKMVEVLLPNDNQLRHALPEDLNFVKCIDNIWMISQALKIPDTPMWVGFNSILR